jgi:hypothetical protein
VDREVLWPLGFEIARFACLVDDVAVAFHEAAPESSALRIRVHGERAKWLCGVSGSCSPHARRQVMTLDRTSSPNSARSCGAADPIASAEGRQPGELIQGAKPTIWPLSTATTSVPVLRSPSEMAKRVRCCRSCSGPAPLDTTRCRGFSRYAFARISATSSSSLSPCGRISDMASPRRPTDQALSCRRRTAASPRGASLVRIVPDTRSGDTLAGQLQALSWRSATVATKRDSLNCHRDMSTGRCPRV